MKRIARYITPLSVIFFGTFLFAVKLFFTDSGHGPVQYLSIMLVLLVALPALIANALINWWVDERKHRRIMQVVVSVALISLLGVFVWRFFF